MKSAKAHTTNPPVHPEPVEACPEPVEGGWRGLMFCTLEATA
mgnify:CR=1 FL=1|jgi:hypothetical protein